MSICQVLETNFLISTHPLSSIIIENAYRLNAGRAGAGRDNRGQEDQQHCSYPAPALSMYLSRPRDYTFSYSTNPLSSLIINKKIQIYILCRFIQSAKLSHWQSQQYQLYCVHVFTAGLPVSYKLGPRRSVVVTRSDFKSETIFGFLSPDYTGQSTYFL